MNTMENINQNKELQGKDRNQDAGISIGYIHKKTEKLVTAIYMLSNFFPHQEPLRWEVRTFCLNLLGNVSFVFYGKNSETDHILKESANAIDEIILRFEISHIAGLVSSMNFTVLKNELVSLKDNIQSVRAGGGGQNISLTSDFFAHEKLLEEGVPRSGLPTAQAGLKASQGPTLRLPKVGPLSTRSFPKAIETKEVRSSVSSVASQRKGDRSEAILAILRKKDNLTVKDIAHVISDCSEKTIQRELLALVDKSVLKKIGERRWSRYSLA